MKPDKRAPTLEVLESYTKKRWESILHFMIGAPIPDRDKPSPKVVSLLVSMGLMQVYVLNLVLASHTQPLFFPTGKERILFE